MNNNFNKLQLNRAFQIVQAKQLKLVDFAQFYATDKVGDTVT